MIEEHVVAALLHELAGASGYKFIARKVRTSTMKNYVMVSGYLWPDNGDAGLADVPDGAAWVLWRMGRLAWVLDVPSGVGEQEITVTGRSVAGVLKQLRGMNLPTMRPPAQANLWLTCSVDAEALARVLLHPPAQANLWLTCTGCHRDANTCGCGG